MTKRISASLLALAILFTPEMASAHVSVQPARVAAGDFTTFNVSVPNEKEVSVTNIKLDIPKGLEEVKPTIKPGWAVKVEGSSIIWSGGDIASGFRDDFTFSAQAPAKTIELKWKAYETYSDGSVARWDQSPDKAEVAGSDSGPYSVTKVSNESDASSTDATNTSRGNSSNTLPLVISLLALTLSFGNLLFKKRA